MNIINIIKKNFASNSFFVWILMVGLIPLISVSYISSSFFESSIKEQVFNNLSLITKQKKDYIEDYIQTTKTNLTIQTTNPVLIDFMTKINANAEQLDTVILDNIQTYFTRILNKIKLRDIIVIAPDGKVMLSLKHKEFINNNITTIFKTQPDFLGFINNVTTLLEIQLSSFESIASQKILSSCLASPIFHNNKIVGTLVFVLNEDRIAQAVNKNEGLGLTGETLVGKFLNNTIYPEINLRHGSVQNFMDHRQLFDDRMSTAFADASHGGKGEGLMKDYRGQEVLSAWRYLPSLDSGIMIKMDAYEAFEPIRKMKNNLIILGIITLLSVILVSYFVSNRFQNADNKLQRLLGELKISRDQALESDKTKSSFIANMSHELRTPLNAIIGYSEMLAEEAQEANLDEFVQDLSKINNSGKHLLNLINDILDLSKIESGKMQIYLENASILEIAQNIEAMVIPLFSKNGNILKIECSKDIGYWQTDVTKIRQSLLNLLSNANKFTDKGIITLHIDRVMKEDKQFIQLKVSDTGIGMTPEQLNRMFQAFSQADASTTRKYGGTGLGLFITKSFCTMLGGFIKVESVVDKGTTFTMEIPTDIDMLEDDKSSEQSVDNNVVTVNELDKRKVLVIDDEQKVHEFLTKEFAEKNFKIIHAYNGEDGLTLCRQTLPDVIILDVIMPKMDGWAVLKILKSDDKLKNIPVIMSSLMTDSALGSALGAQEFISKPINMNSLFNVLNKHISNSAPHVLVVEDDPNSRSMVVRALKKQSWRITEATNGIEALQRIKEDIPTVILLDLMMPEMDGFEVVAQLKNNPEWCNIPVIIITAKELTATDFSLLSGVHDIMYKGKYERENLLKAIADKISI